MKSIKLKWLVLIITLFLAFGTVLSVATAVIPEAKADESDIVLILQNEIDVNAGQTSEFTVSVQARSEFSSYELQFKLPYFMRILEIKSEIVADSAVFEYNGNHVSFSSAQRCSGYEELLKVTFTTDLNAKGKADELKIIGSMFTDIYGNTLTVAEPSAIVRVQGEYNRQKGDFDGNGTVEIQDVMYMQRYIVGSYNRPVESEDFWAGDIDCDKDIDIRDCQLIQSYLIGVFDSLDGFGGSDEPHGGDDPFSGDDPVDIYGRYTTELSTRQILLNSDNSFMIIEPDGATKSGTYVCEDGRMVYLVSDYTLETVSINAETKLYTSNGTCDFSTLPATVEGYAENYRINGDTQDTVDIAPNGAFVRNCIEDDYPMQYNGMLGFIDGGLFAYVFGTNINDCLYAIPIDNIDTENNVIYVKHGGEEEKEYNILFYVNNEIVAKYSVKQGTNYSEVFNKFMEEKSQMLINRYGAINFSEYSTDSGKQISTGDSFVEFEDAIRFTVQEEQGNGTENGTEITGVFHASAIKGENIEIYYNSTADEVSGALIGRTISVSKVYRNKNGDEYYEFYQNVEITADMIGDLSSIDFSASSQNHLNIPLVFEGRTTSLETWFVPDLRNAHVTASAAQENVYYNGSGAASDYYLIEFYDNGYAVKTHLNSNGDRSENVSSYFAYGTEIYDGKSLYCWDTPKHYYEISGNITLGRTLYDLIVPYRAAAGQETTDYSFSYNGNVLILKVFGDFAEMWPSNEQGLEVYVGTVKVEIKDNTLSFDGAVLGIGENNVLFPISDIGGGEGGNSSSGGSSSGGDSTTNEIVMTIYNVEKDGTVSERGTMTFNSYDEFTRKFLANGYSAYYDLNQKDAVSRDNFRSGDVYLFSAR